MSSKPTKIATRSTWFIIGSSIPFLLIVTGIIKALVSETSGIVDVTTEQSVFFIGLYLAIPCGLLNLFSGIKALKKGVLKKGFAIAGIMIGILSVAIGLVSWVWFFMVSAFAAAFS